MYLTEKLLIFENNVKYCGFRSAAPDEMSKFAAV